MAGHALALAAIIIAVSIQFSVSQPEIPDEKILKWKPPNDMMAKYPYYLSGYDYEGSPVWVIEFGKWDLKSAVDTRDENFDKYVQQCFRRWVESARNIPDSPGFFVIADLEGYDLAQAGSFAAVQKYLWMVQTFVETIKEGKLKGAYLVNSNYLFQTVWSLSKPLFGQVLEDITLFGTNSEVWKPRLLQKIPKDQMAEWYGGSESHKPVQIFG